MDVELISLELTNCCTNACWFCYNHSRPDGPTLWTVDEVIAFVADCAAHGVKAVSFGGGEPLEYPGLFDVLRRLDGVLFRSVTTNGTLLQGSLLEDLVAARPDKVHVSLHCPDQPSEVKRVIDQVSALALHGIRSGINLLVMRSQLDEATAAAATLRARGIGNDRIIYLPMRGQDTPSPEDLARVAGNRPFQGPSCLAGCTPSPRFVSIDWKRQVAWCSYTTARRPLSPLSHTGLVAALRGLELTCCGGD